MKKFMIVLIVLVVPFFLEVAAGDDVQKNRIIAEFDGAVPCQWGETIPGVGIRLATSAKVLALTFDVCGSKNDGCDWRIINFLKKENIPATIFVSGRWIDAHPEDFRKLAGERLFEIENHGLTHRPCSINGRAVYGIVGTGNAGEVFDEIEGNGQKIEKLTGRKPRYYRSGTAYYDDIGIRIAGRLGYEIAGFAVLGDAGATFNSQQVRQALLGADNGAIIILHLNHPGSGTADGVITAVPELEERGFTFVRLSAYGLMK
jgi:peptidoglycan/xylan/chitin deacetylase (PgdA/CDA1 family)